MYQIENLGGLPGGSQQQRVSSDSIANDSYFMDRRKLFYFMGQRRLVCTVMSTEGETRSETG